MFLNGVEFALGIVTGMTTLVGVVIGLLALADWATNSVTNQLPPRKCTGIPSKAVGTYQNNLLLMMRRPDWMDEAEKQTHSKYGREHPLQPVHRVQGHECEPGPKNVLPICTAALATRIKLNLSTDHPAWMIRGEK